MDEALGTQAKLCGHLRDGARRSPALELCKRESDGRMPRLLPGCTCQEESFEDAHQGFWRLGRLQLLAQADGGRSPERRKINDLVGQFGGRHWQKRARAAGLKQTLMVVTRVVVSMTENCEKAPWSTPP